MVVRGSDISARLRRPGCIAPERSPLCPCASRAPPGQPYPPDYGTAGPVTGAIIGPVRGNPATIVVLAGHASEGLLAAVGQSMNVVLVRPEDSADGLDAAAGALRRAAGISSPYVLVAADPLAAVAAEWRAMWEIPREPSRTAAPAGSEAFELRAAEALAAWRGNRFELPDYYVALVPAGQRQHDGNAAGRADADEQRPDFYLGPLRSVRPHRVAVVAAAEPAEQAASLLSTLGDLPHGRWWPPLDEVIDAARRFYRSDLT